MAWKGDKDFGEGTFNDLLQPLNNSKIQTTNFPLFQVLSQIIQRSNRGQVITVNNIKEVVGQITEIGDTTLVIKGNIDKFRDVVILTGEPVPVDAGTSTLILPNARELLAGVGVTFNDSVANQRTISATGLGGDVVGPAGATDNGVVRFDGNTGKLIQDTSGPLLEDDGRITTVTDPIGLQDAATKNYVDEAIADVIGGGPTQNSFLVSGGQVAWVSDYNFLVSAATYYIDGILYSSPQTAITLDASDPTDDRIDTIAVDDTGTVIKITGTAASTPSEPDIDPGTQLKLAIVFVPAASTEPGGATQETVYYDNAGGPAEWNWTTSGASFNVDSINNPYTGTKDIEGTAVTAGHYAQGDIPASSYDPNLANLLVLHIRSKAAWANNRGLAISFRTAGVLQGSTVNINRTGSFGFNSATVGSYQLVAIPVNLFTIPVGTTITQVRITAFGNGHGFYIDDIYFQEGATSQPPVGITQDQADARYLRRANNLSDVASASTSRTNLGLGALAVLNDVTEAQLNFSDNTTANASTTKHGLLPKLPNDATKYLDGTGSYSVPSGATGISELTGDVTAGPGSGAQAATIANDAVTNAKLANVNTQTIKGRTTAGSGDPEDLTATQATAILDALVGDSGSGGIKGLVPAPAAGDAIAGKYLKADGNWTAISAGIKVITVVIDGGGSAITTGVKGDVYLPFAGTITEVVLLADQSGSIVIDIWKDTYANYPPTDADSITSATPPTLSAAVKSQDTTLSGWTTSISSGNTLRFNVDSAATVTRVTLIIKVAL